MNIQLRTRTPIWTGGVETGKIDRLHETGILGSMRWWMEALVRGMGGHACNPIETQCLYDANKPDNGLCDVCRIFGTTGWRKRFRTEIEDYTQSLKTFPQKIATTGGRISPKTGRPSDWYNYDREAKDSEKPRSGSFTLQIQSLNHDFKPTIIGGLIQFLADWAAIGARPQMGFGVIELTNGRIDTQPLYDWLVATVSNNDYPQLPSLRNIFTANIQIPNATDVNTFNLKYDLRRLFAADQQVRHFIMGTVQGDRMASKIKVSQPYGDGMLRVWGWIPQEATQYRNGWNRDRVAQAIHDHLQTNYALQVWREFDSPRDSVVANSGDMAVFLRSLLNMK